MKRTVQFKKTDNGFACFDGDENIFEISASNLQFNVKDFYQAFYSEGKDFEEIEIQNCIEDDKTANRVYLCITKLIEQIKTKMVDLAEDEDAAKVEEGEDE